MRLPEHRDGQVPKGPSIKVVREVLRLGVRGTQSGLDGWMRANYVALKHELKPHRTNWEALAARLSQEGLTNAAGAKLTAATARKTWQRVRAELAHPPRPIRRQALYRSPGGPWSRRPSPPPLVEPEPEPERFRHTRPARMRGLPSQE